MLIKRNIELFIKKILHEYRKMVFLSGPRQVGKTTFAKYLQKQYQQGYYFNWDNTIDQKKLIKDPYFFEKIDREPQKPFLIVFDEIHKYTRWKKYLKGAFDKYQDDFHFLVTGSGRLDLFNQGGESLLGRYFSLPLYPFSVGELNETFTSYKDFKHVIHDPPLGSSSQRESYEQLFEMTGFPDPYTRNEKAFYNIWSTERKKLLVREDIRDATAIRQLSSLELLTHLLPDKVGSLLSINSLREDLHVAFETVHDWVGTLEKFYYLFQIPPFHSSLSRTIKKEKKAYLYDWGEIKDRGIRFENIVGFHLQKAVQLWKQTGEGKIELAFIRDKEKREVDFVLLEEIRPVCLIECKSSDTDISASLKYFQEKLQIPYALQLVDIKGISRKIKTSAGALWVMSADRWLGLLP